MRDRGLRRSQVPCVCVCVSEREREKERKRARKGDREREPEGESALVRARAACVRACVKTDAMHVHMTGFVPARPRSAPSRRLPIPFRKTVATPTTLVFVEPEADCDLAGISVSVQRNILISNKLTLIR